MTTVSIPYSKSHIDVSLPEQRLKGVLESRAHRYKPEACEEELVRRALENPIASSRLCDLAKGCKKIVIITSDHTRPVPTKIISPLLLTEIRSKNPDAEITFLVATGFHRGSTQEELLNKFGGRATSERKNSYA